MSDVVDKATRSRMMAGIRGRDTKIEVAIRKALWQRGFRYRLPKKVGFQGLPGIPDMVFPRYKAVILTNGCFFHGHDCHLFKWPLQNQERWQKKISGNRLRDRRFALERQRQGWKTLVIWECSMRGRSAVNFDELIRNVESWLQNDPDDCELTGWLQASSR